MDYASLLKIGVGMLAGGGLGFTYYKLIGCSTGACPLTSNPFISTFYGAAMGALIAAG